MSYAVKNNGPLVHVNIIGKRIETEKELETYDRILYAEGEDSLFKYSWAIDQDSDTNTGTAEMIEKYMNHGTFFKKRKKSFVGELNVNQEEFVTRKGKKQRISHIVLSLDAGKTEQNDFQKGLKDMAFQVHRFYAKEYNSRESLTALKKDFRKSYNMTSSMRSAVTIPYKLASVLREIPNETDRKADMKKIMNWKIPLGKWRSWRKMR